MSDSEMAEDWRARKLQDKERKTKNLEAANPKGWTIHTQYHWSRTLAGHRLDYWPSRNKFMYRGKVMVGDVARFIAKRELAEDY